MVVIFFEQSGLGDLIIYTNYLMEISKKYGPVTLLAKKSSRADEIFKHDESVKKIIYLDRQKGKSKHSGIRGAWLLSKEIKNSGTYEAAFLFSSSLRYTVIFKLAGIKKIFQYPLFKQKDDIVLSAKLFTEKCLNQAISTESRIKVPSNLVEEAKRKYNIDNNTKNIVIGGSASGPTKIWPTERFLALCEKLQKKYPCKFLLAGGPNDQFINHFLNSPLKKSCVSLKELSISEILPIISNANLCISNDSSFLHISASLNIKCIGLFGDSPLCYASWSKNINVVEAPGLEGTTTHDSLSMDKISLESVYNKAVELLNL